MEIYDFLEKYRDVKEKIYNDDSYNSFEDSIYRKKEFYENRLSNIPETVKKGNLLNHQKFMANFLSSYTIYDEILLFHEPGTGKTCTSIAAIEKIKNEDVNIDGAIIITRGDTLREQYINQLLFDCTQGQYIPENFDKLKDDKAIKKAKKEKIKEYYRFYTFYEFAKKVSKMSIDERQKEFSNKIIVIDEIHNIKFSDTFSDKTEEKETEDIDKEDMDIIKKKKSVLKLDIYKIIHEVLHQIYNRKIILMSGTPMNDKPEEISDIMNLILPLSKQLPTGKYFTKEYFRPKTGSSSDLILIPEKIKKLKNILKGRISYLTFMKTDVKNEYIGEYNNEMTIFKTELTYMKDLQNDVYKSTMSKEEQGKGVYLDSRQCSLFVFPDSTYGSVGFGINIETKSSKGMGQYELIKDIKDLFERKTYEQKLKVLENYSCKYASLIRNLINPENKDKLSFVYCSFVEGSGLIVLCKILEMFGFNQNFGNISKSGNQGSYSVITGKTSDKEIRNVLSIFNSKENRHGKNIRVLIGSESISEGINLKNIQDIYILTPYWNFAETKQALSRGIRTFSHNDLKEEGLKIVVKIHLICSVPTGDDIKEDKSIDLIMYKTSENKYKNIKLIENIISVSSVDCALNIKRNCDEIECSYSCDNIKEIELKEEEIDYSSYLFRYTNIYKKYLLEILEETFLKEDFIDLNNIVQIVYNKINKDNGDINIDVNNIIKIISIYIFELIDSSRLFTDKNGDKGFLNQQENIIFLLKDKDSKNKSYIEYFYNENEYLKQNLDSKEVLQIINKEYSNVYSLTILKYIINSNKFESIILLPLINQELVLEYCILSNVLNKDKNKDFVDYVMKHYSNFINRVNNTYISSLLFKDKTILRCLDDSDNSDNSDNSDRVWRNCNEDEITSWIQEKEEKKEEKNIYGISGIITKKGDFKIKFEEKDRFTGKTCTSYNMKELLPILKKLEIIPKIKSELQEYHYYIEEIIINTCYMKEITRKKFFSKYKIDTKELELEEGESEDLKKDLNRIIIYIVDKFFTGEGEGEEEEKSDKKKLKFFKKELVKHIIKKRQEKDKLKKYEFVRNYYEEEMKLELEEKDEKEDDTEEKLIKYITSKNIKEILSMSFWSREKKQNACEQIKTFFNENNMISYE